VSDKHRQPKKQDWSCIKVLIENGATPDKSDIVGALRNATSEIDDIIHLMHTAEVAAFLQGLREDLDPAVEQFIDTLNELLFKCLPIIPAEVQHYIADLIDPPKRAAHRPKQKLTDMARVLREHRKLDQARQDVDEMKALLARHHGDEKAAFAAFAKTKGKSEAKRRIGITVAQAKRRYRQAAKLVEPDPAELAAAIEYCNEQQRALRAAASEIAAALIEMEDLDFNEKNNRIEAQFPDATEWEITVAFGLADRMRRAAAAGSKADEVTPAPAK
jgi:hypothetical protein